MFLAEDIFEGENVDEHKSEISKLDKSNSSTSGNTCAPLGISTKVGVSGVIHAWPLYMMTSCFPASPTRAVPPLCPKASFVPSAYDGIGVARIVATCTAPIAPIMIDKGILGKASVMARAVAIPA